MRTPANLSEGHGWACWCLSKMLTHVIYHVCGRRTSIYFVTGLLIYYKGPVWSMGFCMQGVRLIIRFCLSKLLVAKVLHVQWGIVMHLAVVWSVLVMFIWYSCMVYKRVGTMCDVLSRFISQVHKCEPCVCVIDLCWLLHLGLQVRSRRSHGSWHYRWVIRFAPWGWRSQLVMT